MKGAVKELTLKPIARNGDITTASKKVAKIIIRICFKYLIFIRPIIYVKHFIFSTHLYKLQTNII